MLTTVNIKSEDCTSLWCAENVPHALELHRAEFGDVEILETIECPLGTPGEDRMYCTELYGTKVEDLKPGRLW